MNAPRFDAKQIARMQAAARAGVTVTELSQRFNCTRNTIWNYVGDELRASASVAARQGVLRPHDIGRARRGRA